MERQALKASEVLSLPTPTETEEQMRTCQELKIFAGLPLTCVHTVKSIHLFNAEMFDVSSIEHLPAGWESLKNKEWGMLCKSMDVPYTGNLETIRERLRNTDRCIVVNNRSSGEETPVALNMLHKYFRVAYCITYHQSQGQTICEAYKIHDWCMPFLPMGDKIRGVIA